MSGKRRHYLARLDVRGDVAEMGEDRTWRCERNPALAALLNAKYPPSGSPAAGIVGRAEAARAAEDLGGAASFPAVDDDDRAGDGVDY